MSCESDDFDAMRGISMTAFWTQADFDDHELVQLVRDPKSGLTAIIALHSTHLGPGAGGTRFWHYAEPADAMRDALDKHLPAMVEKMVAAEIARIAGKRG